MNFVCNRNIDDSPTFGGQLKKRKKNATSSDTVTRKSDIYLF